MITEFLDNINIPKEEQEKYRNIFFEDSKNLDYPSSHPIYTYVQYKNNRDSNYLKERTYQFLKQIYPSLTIDEVDTFISSEKSNEIDKLIKEYKDTLSKYQEYLKTIKPYQEYIEKCKKMKEKLNQKYYEILVKEFEYLFNEEELNQIKEDLSKGKQIRYANKKSECYFGYGINYPSLIDSFSKDNKEIMKGNSNWKKTSIIKDRITFFKKMNIDLGDNYEEYLNNEDIQKMLPALEELAEKIKDKKQILQTEMIKEYYSQLEEYIKNYKRIEETGLLDKEHGYNVKAYEQRATFISTNIKRTEHGIIAYPILCLSMEGLEEYLDHSLIHELNHVYELTIQSVDEEKYLATCGWGLVSGKYAIKKEDNKQNESNEDKRKYEALNEIINEIISQEITTILFNSEVYIFNTKENAKIKGGTSYEKCLFIVEKFYQTYKKEIINSRKAGNMTELFTTIGKENFEALNELVNEFYEVFPGMSFYSAIDSITRKEETEETKKLMEIVQKRNDIILAMEEHSMKNNKTL